MEEQGSESKKERRSSVVKAFFISMGVTTMVIAVFAFCAQQWIFTIKPEPSESEAISSSQQTAEPEQEPVEGIKAEVAEPAEEMPVDSEAGNMPETEPEPEEAKRPLSETTQVYSDLVPATQGTQYATLYAPNVGIEAPLYYGDSADILLTKSFGQSVQTYQVGYQTAHLLCTYDPDLVAGLYQMQIGTNFQVETSYGTYLYTVTATSTGHVDETTGYIVNSGGIKLIELSSERDTVFIYTDYPANAHTNEKYVVRAVLVS